MATVPVVQQTGALITDWSGAALHLGARGEVIAAATPELHARALEMRAD